MKKFLFSLILFSILSCSSSSSEDLVDEIDTSKDNCYNVIMVGTGTVWKQCDVNLVIGLVRHKDFVKGGPFRQDIRTYVCITNLDYTMNDFQLGQLICDYSIYQ